MGAFLGVSLWVALATVVPGLMTMACLYGAVAVISPGCFGSAHPGLQVNNDWILAGLAVTAMVLTQALGILLEGRLIARRRLGPEIQEVEIPEGIDPHGQTQVQIKPYFEYEGLYLLLSELDEHEDAQGHLKRALAQFFMTINSLISFGLGSLFAVLTFVLCPSWAAFGSTVLYTALMGICLVLSFKVAVIRFEVMAKSLWATRRRRITRDSRTS